MKIIFLVSLLALSLAASGSKISISIEIEAVDTEIFEKFLSDFNIELDPSDDIESRREIFMENYRKIRAHNERFERGLETFSMEINEFAHLSEDELMSWHGDEEDDEDFIYTNSTEQTSDDDFDATPESFSWLDQNVLEPVQSQGRCGSCYVFASIAAIEAQMAINFKQKSKLSEQEAMECLNGCWGGSRLEVLRYSQEHKGCASGDSYPYQGHLVEECSRTRPRVSHSRVVDVQRLRSERRMRQALVEYGPISAGLISYSSLHFYSRGVYRKQEGDQRRGGHAILIVGYGEEQRGGKYWIVRNSWGARWGERGYFRIARGENMCNIESRTSFIPRVE